MLEIHKAIKDYYERTGRIPSASDCNGVQLPHYWKVREAGGLRHIITVLGITENKKPLLLESLRRFRYEEARWPKSRDCATSDILHSHNMYVTHFGSWSGAIEEAKNGYI